MVDIEELKNDLGPEWEEIVIRLCEGGNTWKLSDEYGIPLHVLRHAARDRDLLLMAVLKRYRCHLRLLRVA